VHGDGTGQKRTPIQWDGGREMPAHRKEPTNLCALETDACSLQTRPCGTCSVHNGRACSILRPSRHDEGQLLIRCSPWEASWSGRHRTLYCRQQGTAHHGVGRNGARDKILSVCVVAFRFVHMQQGGVAGPQISLERCCRERVEQR
jgi:hypothetical protein